MDLRSFAATLTVTITACGFNPGNGGGIVDAAATDAPADAIAPQIDAAAPSNLGRQCTVDLPCEIDEMCITGFGLPGGGAVDSPSGTGFCTPNCGDGMVSDNAICEAGYSGLGVPMCALGTPDFTVCAIFCTFVANNCPAGMLCHMAGVCIGEDWEETPPPPVALPADNRPSVLGWR